MVWRLNGARLRIAGALCLAMLGLGPAAPGAARALDGTDTLSLAYAIRVRGFELMSFRLNVIVTGENYLASSHLQTLGIAELFSFLRLKHDTAGRLTAAGPRPARFETLLENKYGIKTSIVTWDGEGRQSAQHKPPIRLSKKNDIAEHLKPGIPDPLSVLVALLLNRSDGPCDIARQVYGGRRIFELAFARRTNKPGDASQQPRDRFVCQVRNRPIAGYSARKMAKAAANPPKPVIIDMVRLKQKISGRQILVPVSASGAANWIAIDVRLIEARVNGRPIADLVPGK
jgi:hypothetical protein